jgi:hypothetical protein
MLHRKRGQSVTHERRNFVSEFFFVEFGENVLLRRFDRFLAGEIWCHEDFSRKSHGTSTSVEVP